MLQVASDRRLEEIGNALCAVAERHNVSVLAVTHLGKLLEHRGPAPGYDAMVYTICHTALYTELLSADPRFAAYLPCRLAAIRTSDGVVLETLGPTRFCELIGREDLAPVAAPLESLLLALMADVASPQPKVMAASAMPAVSYLGARENQMNAQSAIPQRIDCRGTKVEDLGGTGRVDSPGG
jgi:uncharacterized protein (DUF302 family)